MNAINIEIKARCAHPDKIRTILKKEGAFFKGTDHQVDTYFKVPQGRLKLREGNIENALIYYQRDNQQGPKSSQIKLFKTSPSGNLGQVLTAALEAWAVVDKQREIYFIENVKFHIDKVVELGSFVEIEAICEDGSLSVEQLHDQCDRYLKLFEIPMEDLVALSYSDMIMDPLIKNVR